MASEPKSNSAMRRYAPFIVIVLVLVIGGVVFAATRKDDDKTSESVSAATDDSGLPLTFTQAQDQGVSTKDWTNCDQDTGRIKIPFPYAAECVEPEADNGGATSPGVTGDEITVVVYLSNPANDAALNSFFKGAALDTDPDQAFQTISDYSELFNQYYETYGRKVKLIKYLGTAAGLDEAGAKADAIKIATEYKPFAVWGGPLQAQSFSDELAARHILCIQQCAGSPPVQYALDRRPYLWGIGPAPEQAIYHAAQFVGKQLVGKNAEFAGDALKNEKRVFGYAAYDATDGRYKPMRDAFTKTLKDEYDTDIAVTRTYLLDLAKAQEDARNIIAAMKEGGVTTVLLSGDPIVPSYLTKAATEQNYFPEWVITATVYLDTAVFGRTMDQEQWKHAFGISLPPARGDQNAQLTYKLYQWQYCKAPPSNIYTVHNQSPATFFNGIQLAGPDLTPENFEKGLFRALPNGGGPTTPLVSRGEHDIWPDLEIGGWDDATVVYWDADATGPDEAGNQDTGLYRYVDGAQRYRPAEWPDDQITLFDDQTSVTLFTEIPKQDQTPDYPSPCSG